MKTLFLLGSALAIAGPASATDYGGQFSFVVTEGGRNYSDVGGQRHFTSYVGYTGILTWKTLTETNVPSPSHPAQIVATLTRNTASLGGIVGLTQTNDPYNDNGQAFVGASYNGDGNSGSFSVFYNGNSSIDQSISFSFVNGLTSATGSGSGLYKIDFATNFDPDTTQVRFEITSGRTYAIVPEPSTWAMMLGGFGLLGMAARRRLRNSVAHA